ncbi:hypothetical protein Tco_1082628 [Tanacetum coccineum]|uniref:Uncharacterized protein n=1 Tax=Tanacetum coccineum TaxID=301880 RepID=A0ABQ5I100_9ASTR
MICRLPWSCVFSAKLPYQVGDVEVTWTDVVLLSSDYSFFNCFVRRTPTVDHMMGLVGFFIKTSDPREGPGCGAWGSILSRPTEIPPASDLKECMKKMAEENAYLELADPDEGTAMVRQSEEEVVTEQPKKIKKKRLIKQSDVLPAKKLRTDHPSLASGTGGKTLAGLEQIMPAGSRLLAREQSATPSVAPPSQESESFVDLSAQASLQIRTTVGSSSTLSAPVDTAAATTTSTKAKLAADVNPDLAGPSQLEESEGSDDSFYELATFDPSEAKRAARQICLGSEVRSRAEHELELKEKLNAKYAARVFFTIWGKSALTAEVSALKVTITQKDHDISLLDSCATHLESALNDAQVACTEVGTKITLSLGLSAIGKSLRFLLCVLVLRISRRKWNSAGRAAQELYNRMADGNSGSHPWARLWTLVMQEGIGAGHDIWVRPALEDASFPLVDLLKSKKDVRMNEVLDCFLLDGPLAGLPKAAYLRPCIEQLSVPIYHAGDKTAVGETSLSFALMNVHARAEGAKKHVAALHMGLLDFIKTADPQKVWAVEVQKGDDHVTLLESTRHCFMPLVTPAANGSSSAAATEIPTPTEGGKEDVAEENAYLELADPDEGTAMVRQSEEEVVTEQSKKVKKRRSQKQGYVLPAKKLMADHPALASGTGGKTLAVLEQIRLATSCYSLRCSPFLGDSSALAIPVDTTVAATTSTGAAATTRLATDVDPDLAGPSHPEDSEGSDDSFYAPTTLDPSEAKRWGSTANMPWVRGEVSEKDLEILRLKSQLAEKEAEAAEVVHLRGQVSSLSEEKSALAAEVSALKVTITQKDHDFSLLDSRATHLESALNDAQVACTDARTKITSLASERDRLVSEVSSLRACFKDFKEKMEVQQETAQEGILGHALGRAVDFGMQEGLEAGHEHGVAGRSLSMVDAYNPEAARASYVDAVKALEDASFPLVDLLKSKKDAGMDEVLDCFLLDGPLAGLPEAAYLRPCIEQLSVPIHHAGDKTAVGETSLSFALMNVHARAEGAKKHAAALRQLMMEIVSAPLSSQTWVGEASTSAAPLSVEDYTEEDTDEALGSVVAVPKLECCHF